MMTLRDVAFAVVTGVLIAGCIVRSITGRRVTGTCDGACDHYLSCKHDGAPTARQRCLSECPEVFSDPKSIRMFENLSCRDAVEFVDGAQMQTGGVPQTDGVTMSSQ